MKIICIYLGCDPLNQVFGLYIVHGMAIKMKSSDGLALALTVNGRFTSSTSSSTIDSQFCKT